MASDLSSYLATHYLITDKNALKSSSKHNLKDAGTPNGLVVQDDDDNSWTTKNNTEDDEDNEVPTSLLEHYPQFRKNKRSIWKIIGGAPDSRTSIDDGTTAEAVIASVVAENEASSLADNDLPLLAHLSSADKMSDGTHAGLQTTASVSTQLEGHRVEFASTQKMAHDGETVYRDATGQRVDLSVRRAEARRAVAEAEEKRCLAKEALKGNVQIEQTRRRREELDAAKFMPVARSANDDAINREQRNQQRWNDPMALFLGAEAPSGDTRKSDSNKDRPSYSGVAVPNRHGIYPGYRWDGVDRSNGFEAMRFMELNRQERNKNLNYSWQTDI